MKISKEKNDDICPTKERRKKMKTPMKKKRRKKKRKKIMKSTGIKMDFVSNTK